MSAPPPKARHWQELSDAELIDCIKAWRTDPVDMMQTEILRRNLERVVLATANFQAATKAQAKADERRAQNEFRFAVWTSMFSLAVAMFGVYLTWKINADAIAREEARELRRARAVPVLQPAAR